MSVLFKLFINDAFKDSIERKIDSKPIHARISHEFETWSVLLRTVHISQYYHVLCHDLYVPC